MSFNRGELNVVLTVHDVTNNLLSDPNYLVNKVMLPKFGNFIITVILLGFDQKTRFFKRWSRFKFNNLGLALGIAWQSHISVTKALKLKVRKFQWLTPTFEGGEVTRENLVGGVVVTVCNHRRCV